MKILGVDPGYDRLGVAVVSGTASKPELIYSGCIKTSSKDRFVDRLVEIYQALSDVIEKYRPDEASVEDIFFTTNQKTAVKVSEARGVILLACELAKVKTSEYTPLQIKSSLTGYGKADKSQVEFIVRNILKIPKSEKKIDDEMDAIAIALTHLFSRR